jgi:hypothetical protein
MNELVVRAEFWLKLVGHYLEPVRLVISFYKAFRWLIKLPGRAVNAYRELRDWFRFMRELPQRIVGGFLQIVGDGLWQVAAQLVSKIVRTTVVVGLCALVGTALYFAARGTARIAS